MYNTNLCSRWTRFSFVRCLMVVMMMLLTPVIPKSRSMMFILNEFAWHYKVHLKHGLPEELPTATVGAKTQKVCCWTLLSWSFPLMIAEPTWPFFAEHCTSAVERRPCCADLLRPLMEPEDCLEEAPPMQPLSYIHFYLKCSLIDACSNWHVLALSDMVAVH